MKKILILAANPPDTQRLRLDEEVREIENVTKIAQSQGKIKIICQGAIRVDDLQELLLESNPNIVHFCGHGDEDNGLIVEDRNGQKKFINSESLAELFKSFKNYVECVVLNACYSAVLAEAIYQHIDCVIGMNNALGDKAAIKFATGFYQALSNGRNYQDSFDIACNRIDLHGIRESETPQIKIRDSSKDLLIKEKKSQDKLQNILQIFFDKKEIFQKAYTSSLPDRLTFDNKPESPESIINYLNLPQQNKKYSYLQRFVAKLLLDKNVTGQLKQELNKWAEEYINDYEQLLGELKEEQQIKQRESFGIFVAIIEEGGSYTVKAWLNKNIAQSQQKSLSHWQQITIEKQDAITDKKLSKLPSILRKLINNSGVDIKQIHVFLPYKLMNHPVDSWKISEDDDETIGEFYQVIIRCSQRMVGREPRILRWKTKGEKIKSTIRPSAIFKSYDYDNHKMIENDCKKDEVIAVQITNVFQEEQPGTILWKSAIPLALWIRTKLNNIDNKAVLQELINNCPSVQDIPKQVKNQRLDIQTDIGRHLCLLWDDPNLLPPTQNLTQNKL